MEYYGVVFKGDALEHGTKPKNKSRNLGTDKETHKIDQAKVQRFKESSKKGGQKALEELTDAVSRYLFITEGSEHGGSGRNFDTGVKPITSHDPIPLYEAMVYYGYEGAKDRYANKIKRLLKKYPELKVYVSKNVLRDLGIE